MASDQSSASESTPNGGETRTPSPSIQWAAAFQSPEFTTGLQAAITQALRQSRGPIDQGASLEELGNPANTFRAATRTVHQLETQVGGSQSRQNTGMLNAPLFVAISELNGAETNADSSVNITQTLPNGISENRELARQFCPSAFVSNSSPENAFASALAELQFQQNWLNESLNAIQQASLDISITLAPEKCERPTTCIIFLGIELNSITMTARLPDVKLLELRTTIVAWKNKKFCTRKELESLVCKLSHACVVVALGRTFLKRLLNLLRSSKPNQKFIRLTKQDRLDLHWWGQVVTGLEWDFVF
jgi:hypothetical protein